MDIVFKDADGGIFRIPVNPEEITISREKLIETKQFIRAGEVDFASPGEKIKTISFSSFFPMEYDSGYCQYPDIPDPQQAMQYFTTLTSDPRPVRFIISETQVNVLVLFSAHDSIFRGGEPGDVYYDATLRVYREIKIKKANEPQAATGFGGDASTADSRTDTRPTPPMYTVRSGDTLTKIAKFELKDMGRWREIYDIPENTATIGPNPNNIKPGMRLILP